MTCRGWNPQIALYVEGDLEPEFAQELDQHLGHCEECRRFADSLRDSQSEIRQLRSEVLPSSSLDRVRANVLQRVRLIEERRTWMGRLGIWFWGGFRWRYAVLSSVALLLVSLMAWRLSVKPGGRPIPLLQVATNVSAPLPTALVLPNKIPMAVKRPLKRPVAVDERTYATVREAAETAVEEEGAKPPETLVQIQTDDPNVVIYWLIDQPGGF